MRHLPLNGARCAGAALALALLAACADQPAGPAGQRAAVPGARFTSGGRTLIPNTQKYRDAGLKPATGRSGSATLTARALQSRSGLTTLEVTTGQLDSSTPAPGTLSKVQVKAIDGSGTQMFDAVFNPASGGSASLPLNGLIRGQSLQVKGSVRGIDPSRTDIVTVTETVKLRPDLTIGWDAPARVPVNVPVVLTATVSELNGDVGARADCLLSDGGVTVDQAEAIWVDAGDAVTCIFNHTFQQTGNRLVTVRVANVQPADFDPMNQFAQATIEVTSGPNDFDYQAYASQGLSYSNTLSTQTWRNDSTGVTGISESEDGQRSEVQRSTLYATLPRSVWPIGQLALSQSSGGTLLHSVTLDSPAGWQADGFACTYEFLDRGVSVHVCTSTGNEWSAPWTQVSYERTAGMATYHGRRYAELWDASGTSTYVYHLNYSNSSSIGTFIPFGNDFSFQLALTAGDSTYQTSPAFPLTGGTPFENVVTDCGTAYDPWYYGGWVTACTTWTSGGYNRMGFAYGTPTAP